MMAESPRVVAELGRPETADETATRKAESSWVYRSSQTFRNLIAALIATLGIVVAVVVLVPRGEPAPRDAIDVDTIAGQLAASQGRTVVAPELGEGWVVNLAQLDETGGLSAWNVVFAQKKGFGTGYLRVAQGFDADPAWSTRVLSGADAASTVTIAGIEWSRFDISDSSRTGNVSVALSAQAGPDTVLIYGSTDDANLQKAAASVADDIRSLRDEAGE